MRASHHGLRCSAPRPGGSSHGPSYGHRRPRCPCARSPSVVVRDARRCPPAFIPVLGGRWASALLRLLDCPFDFLCPSCMELLFIWSQLVEELQELSRVTEFFTGDVHKHRDGELVVR